jgi:ABC-type transport system involved in cytochrome c biogenesis permease subunit
MKSSQLVYLLRASALIVVAILFFSFAWAGSAMRSITVLYFLVQGCSLVVYALCPRRAYFSNSFRKLVQGLAVVAVMAAVPMVLADITLPNGADWNAIVMRSLICGLFVAMFIEAKRYLRPQIRI